MAGITYKPSLPYDYLVPKGANAKTFSLVFNDAELVELANLAESVEGRSAAIIADELRLLGKEAVEPVFQAFAPYKSDGSGFGTTRADAAANTNDGTWSKSEDQHLRSTIQARMDNRLGMLTLRMAWYGRLTEEGRDPIVAEFAHHPLRIELPGGQVILRASVKGATSPRVRMDWGQRAFGALMEGGAFQQTAINIATRMVGVIEKVDVSDVHNPIKLSGITLSAEAEGEREYTPVDYSDRRLVHTIHERRVRRHTANGVRNAARRAARAKLR